MGEVKIEINHVASYFSLLLTVQTSFAFSKYFFCQSLILLYAFNPIFHHIQNPHSPFPQRRAGPSHGAVLDPPVLELFEFRFNQFLSISNRFNVHEPSSCLSSKLMTSGLSINIFVPTSANQLVLVSWARLNWWMKSLLYSNRVCVNIYLVLSSCTNIK